MPARALSKAITPAQSRDLIEAAHHASTIGKPLNTFVAINPRLLDLPPSSIADWTLEVLNKVRIFMNRLPLIRGSRGASRKVGYYLIWARENYEGIDREHLHLLIHCPPVEMRTFKEWLSSQYPGEERAIYVEKAIVGTNRFTRRRQNFSIPYVLKQCTPQAWWATGMQIMREKACKHTGAKVAAVLGKRCGVSATLNGKARDAYRLRPSSATPDTRSTPTGLSMGRISELVPLPILGGKPAYARPTVARSHRPAGGSLHLARSRSRGRDIDWATGSRRALVARAA